MRWSGRVALISRYLNKDLKKERSKPRWAGACQEERIARAKVLMENSLEIALACLSNSKGANIARKKGARQKRDRR